MSGKKHSSTLIVLRTEQLEVQLQTLWALRPEMRDNLSVTVDMAVAALIRESKALEGQPPSAATHHPSAERAKSPELVINNPDIEWN